MSESSKQYDPKEVDGKWYQFWESHNLFRADVKSDKPSYCIVMPPPNVTGVLHMGHALVSTLQDVLIRWKRMSGYETLWVPGVDHAGISTQTVVERNLLTRGIARREMARDDFLAEVWNWKAEKEKRICEQLRQLGCSCDWSRYQFTMNEQSSRAVRVMFKRLYDDGLIYRGNYLVNWDPVTQTALADDEVETMERETSIYTIRIPLKEQDGYVAVATTRPETMFGDVAVAVHPSDERYAKWIGASLAHPFRDVSIPLIADHEVDPTFGTGAVKITPAHDHNDYRMAQRQNLPILNMMTADGLVNELGGHYAGQTLEAARHNVVEELKKRGLVEKIEPHTQRVGISYRSKAVIEPYMSKQWFVRMDGFAVKLRSLVEEGRTQLLPKNWEATYFHWIDNLRDWCISRQLWWGHRIPIWYHVDDPDRLLCYDGEGVPPEVAAAPDQWKQESDVLDTWFSSGLWPFSTLGWPEKTPELLRFYPNSVLVTGFDILFFWVARMMLMGEYAMGETPFPESYLHGLIYGRSYWRKDEKGGVHYISGEERVAYDLGQPLPQGVHSKWEKLSKSKGNVIDPSEIIDEYGTDAMRMALCASGPQNLQIDLDRRRFEEFRNFANKIWNGARFILMNLDPATRIGDGIDLGRLQLEDRWILSALNRAIGQVNEALESYQFDKAAIAAYEFYWNDFCAYYLEICKPVLFGKRGNEQDRLQKQRLLLIVLTSALRLLHPMAPFITEELFQVLKERFGQEEAASNADPYTCEVVKALQCTACMVASYPSLLRRDEQESEVLSQFELVRRTIYAIRNIRGEMGVTPGMATDLYVIGPSDALRNHIDLLTALVRLNQVHFSNEEPAVEFASTAVIGEMKLLIPLPEQLQQQELQRLEKEQRRLVEAVERLRIRLSNSSFVDKAPAELVERSREELRQLEREKQQISEKITSHQ
jgi:valyl-tRNA synthetase